jgi:prophage DNA circulation protein
MDEILALLKKLGELTTTYVKPGTENAAQRQKEVLDKIRTEHTETLWQPIANVAFAAGKAARDVDVTVLEQKVAGLETVKTGLESQVATLSDKNKDVAAVQREAAEKITKAEAKAKDEVAKAKAKVKTAFQSRDVTAYESRLISKGVHPDNAKAQGILLRERMEYDDDGVLTVMQEGDSKIPYTVHGEELLTVLAETTAKKLPATMFISKVDDGGGSGGDKATGGGGGGGDVFARIRADEKVRAEAQKPADIAAAYGRSA